jgi:hypothetical protein
LWKTWNRILFCFATSSDLICSFQQSTGKCKWESYEGRNKFVEELQQRQLLARNRGYGPDYVASFVEKRKKNMREYARRNRIPTPFSVWEAKYLA